MGIYEKVIAVKVSIIHILVWLVSMITINFGNQCVKTGVMRSIRVK